MTDRGRMGEISHVLVHSPNDCKAGAGSGGSQEPETLPSSPKHLGHPLLPLRAHHQGAGWKVEQQGQEAEPMWNASITDDSLT